jgi:hypothetical protein
MNCILEDEIKFKLETNGRDETQALEKVVCGRLKQLLHEGKINQLTAEEIRPRGSQMPRLYGLPKIHKNGVPLRPILSMLNSPCHKVAQWLVKLLEPVRAKLVKHAIKDTFQLVEEIAELNIANSYMTSFDVSSLFTNIPVEETINIICEHATDISIPVEDLRMLLRLCTKNVQFRFDGKLYRQIDGIGMGSPLGCLFADIFMSQIEEAGRHCISTTTFYRRYVDDTLIICKDQTHAIQLLREMNTIHPNIRFTCEMESENKLPFLDLILERRSDGSIRRTIYHKPTWNGQYLHFHSYVPINYKRGLVKTLFSRARKLCTEDALPAALEEIKNALVNNGYPERFISRHNKSMKSTEISVARKPIFIKLPFKGDEVSDLICHRLNSALKRSFFAARLVLLHTTRRVPTPMYKDSVPFLNKSKIIYQFDCICGSKYIGRSERNLSVRLREHLPQWLLKGENRTPRSAISKHLLDTGHHIVPDQAFRVINRQRSGKLLRIAEAVAIRRLHPVLCVQKEMVVELRLPW